MAKLNQLNCDASYKNVGFGSCFLDPVQMAGAFIFNAPKSFTAAELDDFFTTLQDLAWNDSSSARTFPVHNFVQMTDNSEDLIIQTFDYGAKSPVRDGDYDWTGLFRDGGLCLQSALRTLNGKRWVLFYDKNNVFYGYNNQDKLTTIPLQFFWATPWKLATGSTSAQYQARFVFQPKYLNEFIAFAKVEFDPGTVVGLNGIDLVVNSFNSTTGAANISVNTQCGGVNLYELYSTQLANSALWSATNKETGGIITVTSVTGVPTSETFDVVLNAADPDYPTSGTIDLTLAAASVLTAAGIEGYEAEVLELAVPNS